MRLLGWALIQSDWCSYRKKKCGHRDTGVRAHTHAHTEREKIMWGFNEKAAICKSRREASAETKLLTPWSWTSGLQTVRKQTLLLFKSPNLWYFVMAAQVNWNGAPLKMCCVEKSQRGVEERKRERRKQGGVHKSHVPLLDQDGQYHNLLPTALHHFLDQYY